MKWLFTTLFVACSFFVASAQDTNSGQTPEARRMEKIARQHMQDERILFNSATIRQAEQLYVRASKAMREGGNAKILLDSVVVLYPQLNRAGCAQLYRAQQEAGQEREHLLKDCIARFSSCYYGDGAQVGPLAIFELAKYYQLANEDQRARGLFRKLRKKYPESVAHDGVLLIDKI